MGNIMEPVVKFIYRSFECSPEELEALLNEAGAEGWRLHTCDPIGVVGVEGVGSLLYCVVMDQILMDEIEEPTEEEEVQAFEGIAMKS